MRNKEYSIPLAIAIIIHVAIIAALIISAPASTYRLENNSDLQPVIHASVINKAPLSAQEPKPQPEQQQLQKLQQLQAAAEAARKAKIIETQKLAQIKAAQIAAEQQKQRAAQLLQAEQLRQAKITAQQAAQAKALELKKQADAAKAAQAKALADKKLRALAEQKKQAELVAKQQALQQQLMQQQLASDQQEITQAQQMEGLVDIYRARILTAIGREWLIPDGADRTSSCTFVIEVTAAGIVTNAQLISSSGNPALDRAAETAIYKASPLPIPKDPVLYATFKRFRLRMKPEGIVQ